MPTNVKYAKEGKTRRKSKVNNSAGPYWYKKELCWHLGLNFIHFASWGLSLYFLSFHDLDLSQVVVENVMNTDI